MKKAIALIGCTLLLAGSTTNYIVSQPQQVFAKSSRTTNVPLTSLAIMAYLRTPNHTKSMLKIGIHYSKLGHYPMLFKRKNGYRLLTVNGDGMGDIWFKAPRNSSYIYVKYLVLHHDVAHARFHYRKYSINSLLNKYYANSREKRQINYLTKKISHLK